MRSLEESRQRWRITQKHSSSLDDLKKSVRSDRDESPCKAGLRSVCWKVFLLFQTTEVTGWSRALVDSRGAYTSLREHLLRYIENPDELGSALDPLDDDRHSPWNTLRQDEELRALIFQDVERCMPEDPYFRQPHTQRIMLDVLFIFCKINQDVGYRQGMHEVLAPILWVVDQDALSRGDASEPPSRPQLDGILDQVLDPAYIEHDAFTLLSLIMRTAKSFYELGEPDKRSSTQSSGPGTPLLQSASPIVERSKRIHEVYLARLDPALAKHLTDIEVLPQIFLIRWIRLLFGREFPFNDLLELWDVILAEDPGLDLVDMVCVSMLLRIRWQLEANYSVALMLLLKYPAPSPPHDPQSFVDDAIYLRDNFSATGGANIISKYSGRSPPVQSTDSRPSTPLGQVLSPRQKLSRTMSPLQSPARFLQQQGGVEALLRGAAKGVYDRGEKLGINKAVRDAAGEVKKNMQGLQVSRPNSQTRRTSDGMRWSLDEGRSVPSTKISVTMMNDRNQQLARMLDQAVSDLSAASVSREAMDLACAKIDSVRVYLEDSTMPLPTEQSGIILESPSPPPPILSLQLPHQEPLDPATPPVATKHDLDSLPKIIKSDSSPKVGPPTEAVLSVVEPLVEVATRSVSAHIPETVTSRSDVHEAAIDRPRAPVPTRSTIANSSFSWMLEPDHSSSSTLESSPSFLKSGKKATSSPSRGKAAFLFGDEGAEPRMTGKGLALLEDMDEGFNLTSIKNSKEK